MSESIGDDLLEGAAAIAAELKWPVRKVYHAVEQKWGFPIWKDGGQLWSSKSHLKNYIARRAEEAMNRPPQAA